MAGGSLKPGLGTEGKKTHKKTAGVGLGGLTSINTNQNATGKMKESGL